MQTQPHRKYKCPVIEYHDPDLAPLREVNPGTRDLLGEHADHCMSVAYLSHRSSAVARLPDVTVAGLYDAWLGEHCEQASKEAHGLIFGDLVDWRADVFTQSVCALAYDIDGWLPFDDVLARREAASAFGFTATTYNHGRKTTTLLASEVSKWRHDKQLPGSAILTDNDTRSFLDEHDAGRKAYLTGARTQNGGNPQEHAVRGKLRQVYLIEHDPEPKSRSVIVLSEPIDLNVVGQDGYRAIYSAVGEQYFGRAANGVEHYDTACKNPSHIFWNPARPPGASGHSVTVHRGALFNWRPLWEKVRPATEVRREVTRKRHTEMMHAAPTDVAEVALALQRIPPSLGRAEWFSVICAIHRETGGSESGREMAHAWSAGAPDLYDPDDLNENIWDRLEVGRSGGATMGTLIWLARKYDPAFQPVATPNIGWLDQFFGQAGSAS